MAANRTHDDAAKRTMLLEHLQLANRHVVESEHRVTRQLRVLARLRAKSQATATAEWFLGYLRTSQVVHLAGRERLLQELAILDERLVDPTET